MTCFKQLGFKIQMQLFFYCDISFLLTNVIGTLRPSPVKWYCKEPFGTRYNLLPVIKEKFLSSFDESFSKNPDAMIPIHHHDYIKKAQ